MMKRLLILSAVLVCLAFAGQQFPSRMGAHFYKVASCTTSAYVPDSSDDCPSLAEAIVLIDSIAGEIALESLGLQESTGVDVWRGGETTYVAVDTVWAESMWTVWRVGDSVWQDSVLAGVTDTLAPHYNTPGDTLHNLYTDTLHYHALFPAITGGSGTDTLAFHFGKADTNRNGSVDTLWGPAAGVTIAHGTAVDTLWTLRMHRDTIFGQVSGALLGNRILVFANGLKATILRYDTAYSAAAAAVDTAGDAWRRRDTLTAGFGVSHKARGVGQDTVGLDTVTMRTWMENILRPPGELMTWYGDSALWPSGYVLCNGALKYLNAAGDSVVTPDYRNAFIVGASGDSAGQPSTTLGSLTGEHTTAGSVDYTPAGSNSSGAVTSHSTATGNILAGGTTYVTTETHSVTNSTFTGTAAKIIPPYRAAWILVKSKRL
jgi:hypothetical protein